MQSEDGACERRPSRSRKPSEKMKDLIEAPPASGKRGARSGKIDLLDGQHADIMAMQDAIPDSAFDSAALGSDTCADAAEFREDTIPVQGMSPIDLGWYSVYLVYWYKSRKTDVATVIHSSGADVYLTALEEDFSSHSEEELLDGQCYPFGGSSLIQ